MLLIPIFKDSAPVPSSLNIYLKRFAAIVAGKPKSIQIFIFIFRLKCSSVGKTIFKKSQYELVGLKLTLRKEKSFFLTLYSFITIRHEKSKYEESLERVWAYSH